MAIPLRRIRLGGINLLLGILLVHLEVVDGVLPGVNGLLGGLVPLGLAVGCGRLD